MMTVEGKLKKNDIYAAFVLDLVTFIISKHQAHDSVQTLKSVCDFNSESNHIFIV